MTEYFVPALEPAATAGNLTNLVAERAWFEPERIMVSRPLGDGWQPVTARELEAEKSSTRGGGGEKRQGKLVVRQKDLLDNATPSANSLAAAALLAVRAVYPFLALTARTPTADEKYGTPRS